jgi:hypothetical protein
MGTISRSDRATSFGVVGLASVAMLLVWALALAPAAAATGADGVHVDEAITDTVDVEALADAVSQARGDGVSLQVVVLADEPGGGAQAEADRRVADSGGAVLVMTPQEVGAVSDRHSDAEVDRALDDALDALEDDGEAAAAAAFAEGLDSSGLPFDLPGTGVIVLVVIAFIALSVLPRLLGLGTRRRRHHGAGYGQGPRYGRGYGPGRRRRGGLGAAAMGAAIGGSRSRSRGTGGSRSRGGSSRSRGGGRSRGGSSRRR